MHHALELSVAISITGTPAWLTVIYFLHSESRQPYQRLWEAITNLCPEPALMAVVSLSLTLSFSLFISTLLFKTVD